MSCRCNTGLLLDLPRARGTVRLYQIASQTQPWELRPTFVSVEFIFVSECHFVHTGIKTMKTNFFALLIVLLLSNILYAQGVAPITTFVPTKGDVLTFDHVRDGLVTRATIASINTKTKSLTVDAITERLHPLPGEQPLRQRGSWAPTIKFIEKNFLGIQTKQEVLTIGRFNILTTRVASEDLTFWFAVDTSGSSVFPELVKATQGEQVLLSLRSITRKK